MSKSSYVYMLASGRYGTIYTGVTADLIKRTWEHQEGFIKGFAKEYGVKQLVWYEIHEDIHSAVTREKQIKKWNRAWKIKLILAKNPLSRTCMKRW